MQRLFLFMTYLILSFASVGAAEQDLNPLLEKEQRQEQDNIYTPAETNDQFFQKFLHMLATLAIIIILILIATWFLKKLVNSRVQQINASSLIKILERRALTPKTTVYLLEIQGKTIVVGETHNTIAMLTEFPTQEPESDEHDEHDRNN